jgi:hypothetical protein
MPHVELPQAAFAQEALQEKQLLLRRGVGHRSFHKAEAVSIAESHMVDYLSCGTKKIVFTHPDDPTKVVTAEYWNNSHASHTQNFYLHNVINSLWPNNIPRVFATGKTVGEKPIAWSIREQIVGSEIDGINRDIKYPFSSVKTEAARYGISISHDPHRSNFIVGLDGGEYYVDNLDFWGYLPLNALTYLAKLKKLSIDEETLLITNVIRFNHLAHDRWENNFPAIR